MAYFTTGAHTRPYEMRPEAWFERCRWSHRVRWAASRRLPDGATRQQGFSDQHVVQHIIGRADRPCSCGFHAGGNVEAHIVIYVCNLTWGARNYSVSVVYNGCLHLDVCTYLWIRFTWMLKSMRLDVYIIWNMCFSCTNSLFWFIYCVMMLKLLNATSRNLICMT